MRIDVPFGAKPRNEREAVVLSELLAMTATTRERRAGHWIPVPSTYWRSLIGSRYKVDLNGANEAGYVEVNDRYLVGRFPKSYRLAKKYRRPRTSRYELVSATPPTRIRIAADDHVGLALTAQFSSVNLPRHLVGWNGYCAAQIRSESYYAVRCQYGRFHSSFTGLSRKVRPALRTTDGEVLVEVDVRNCQPIIIGVLASQSHTTTHHHQTDNTICGATDLCNYVKLCERGKLYEHLLLRCKGMTLRDWIPSDKWHRRASDRPLSQRDIKRQFLVMLFADSATTQRIRLFEILCAEFPTVADFILESKRECYQDLARRCQRMESQIIIDGACGATLRISPGTVILTIHDAILTTSSNAEMVADLIRTEFKKWGVAPSFRGTRQ